MVAVRRPRSEFPSDGSDLPALGYKGSAPQKGVVSFSVTLHPHLNGELGVTGNVLKKTAEKFEARLFEGVKSSNGKVVSTITGISLQRLRRLDVPVRREWEATFNDLIDHVADLFNDDISFLQRTFLNAEEIVGIPDRSKEVRRVGEWIITRKASEHGYYYWAEHSRTAS